MPFLPSGRQLIIKLLTLAERSEGANRTRKIKDPNRASVYPAHTLKAIGAGKAPRVILKLSFLYKCLRK